MEEIHGYIERITFQSEENGFTVARLKQPKKRDLTVIVGTMPSIQPGESISCKGTWKNNLQFGMQFDVVTYQVESPSDTAGLKKYLGSGLIKGIGKTYADKIVAKFGVRTFDIISNQSGRLREVDGIGPGRAKAIKAAWDDQ